MRASRPCRESQNEANDSHKAPAIDSALLVTGRKRTATAHARPEVHWLWMDFDRQWSGQGNWSCVVERLVVECQAMWTCQVFAEVAKQQERPADVLERQQDRSRRAEGVGHFERLSACQEAERSHVWNALARHWMLKYQEAHLMSKRMRSEDNWKELLGKSSAKWSLMFGHLCEEPFCPEDALGSLTQVCLSPFCPKIREIGAVRLSNRGETPTPFPPLPPSSPCPGDFHRAEHATRTQQHRKCSLQAGCQHPGKRQPRQNNQNLGSEHSNLYTNTIRTHRLCIRSLQAGCPHPGKRQRGQNNQNLGSHKSNLYTNIIRTHPLCISSLQAGCPHPCKRQLRQNNQNLGSHKSNLYTNTIRTHRLCIRSLQAGCQHPGKRQRRRHYQNLGRHPTRKK